MMAVYVDEIRTDPTRDTWGNCCHFWADDTDELLVFAKTHLRITDRGLKKKNSGAPYMFLTPNWRTRALKYGAVGVSSDAFFEWRKNNRTDGG